MKMTSSLVFFLQALSVLCFASLVAPQTSPPTSSARPPTTQAAMRCPALDNPDGGMVTVTQGTATYTCNQGFTLVGDDTRTCSENTWGGQAPTCQMNPSTPAPSTRRESPASPGGGANGTPMTPSAEPEPTSMPATTDDEENDTDNEAGDTDQNTMDGDNENDGGNGGLENNQIALAILATFLIVGTIAFFAGLIYWKFKGTSYVTVSADTTYLK